MANGKSETRRDAETGILKSETETENFSDLIEKHICDRQTQSLRLRDPLLGLCQISETWVEFAETSHFHRTIRDPFHGGERVYRVVKRKINHHRLIFQTHNMM